MRRDDAEEFTRTVAMHIGASWRQIALAKRLGVPQALGISIQEWVNQTLGGFVKLSVDDRRAAELDLKAEGLSNREIAGVLGVNEGTVRNDLRAENSAAQSDGRSASQALTEVVAEISAPVSEVIDLIVGDGFGDAAKARFGNLIRRLRDQQHVIDLLNDETHVPSAEVADLITMAIAWHISSIGTVIEVGRQRRIVNAEQVWANAPAEMRAIAAEAQP